MLRSLESFWCISISRGAGLLQATLPCPSLMESHCLCSSAEGHEVPRRECVEWESISLGARWDGTRRAAGAQMVSSLCRILTCISTAHLPMEPFTTRACSTHVMSGVTALFALSASLRWGAAWWGGRLLVCLVPAAPMSWQERRWSSWEHRDAWWGYS